MNLSYILYRPTEFLHCAIEFGNFEYACKYAVTLS